MAEKPGGGTTDSNSRSGCPLLRLCGCAKEAYRSTSRGDPCERLAGLRVFLQQPINSILPELVKGRRPPYITDFGTPLDVVLLKLQAEDRRCCLVRRIWPRWRLKSICWTCGASRKRRRPLTGSQSAPAEASTMPPILHKAGLCRDDYATYFLFDVRDLGYFVRRQYEANPEKSVDEILELVGTEKVGIAANASGRHTFRPLPPTAPISAALEAFAHSCRVPIVDAGTRIVALLAPWDFLDLLVAGNILPVLSEAQGLNILQAAQREPFSMLSTESLLKAMTLMERNGFSAIPIIGAEDRDRQVLDAVSVRDLRYLLLAKGQFAHKDVLNAPVSLYLKFVSTYCDTGSPSSRCDDWAFLANNASLEEVLATILAHKKTHRFILVEPGTRKMTGLLTITDLTRLVAAAVKVT